MKMKAAQKVKFESGPNMTPLVDIVMVILIFLMLTGSFAAAEHFLTSNVPVTKKGQPGPPPPVDVRLDEPLEIRIDSFSRPGADGTPVEMWSAQAGGFMIQNSREKLTEQLNRMRENFAKANTAPDKVQIIINPSRITKYKHLIEAYQAALDAQFTKVAFSTAH